MISKAKSRETKIGEDMFRYKVSSTPKCKGVYELNITVQSVEHNGSKLFVSGIIQHDQRVIPSTSSDDYKYRPEIIKADIDGFIGEAIERGWEFTAAGSDFTLPASNEIFSNPFEEVKPEGFYHGRYFRAKI